jgi:bifunctional ADP-heptose synthase (sugar kinase/adenylyltransferase)
VTTLQPKSLRVLLIGESCQDEYHYGECRRLSPEAPVPVFDWNCTKVFPGMATNVKANIEAFGCKVDFISNNPEELLKKRYIDDRSGQQLLRVDSGKLVSQPLTESDFYKKCGRIPNGLNYYDAIIFSDYEKGLIPWDVANLICSNYTGKIFVDSKKNDLTCYENAFLKINEFEEEGALAWSENSEVIVTLGKAGAKWGNSYFAAPKVDVYDVTGAGDVFLATFAVLHTSGETVQASIKKAILMASKSVQHSGTYQLNKNDIGEIL